MYFCKDEVSTEGFHRTCYPLTHPQKAIWYTEKLNPGTSIGNIAATLKIQGEIDYALLEKAINIVIEKNEALRIRVIEKDGEPVQYVSEYCNHRLDFFDFSGQGVDRLYEWDTKQTLTPFSLLDSELFYFALIKLSDQMGGLYSRMHHLIADAWSFVMLGNEIMEYYNALADGKAVDCREKPSYMEYIGSEQKYLGSARFQKDREFWGDKFRTVPDLTVIKASKSGGLNTRAKRKTFVLPIRLSMKLRDYCRENRTSIFALFLAALSMYINRISSREDLVFGTPVLNRGDAREKNMAGMFIGTAPICVQVDDRRDFASFAEEITREWMAILRHQKYPFGLLLKDIREKHRGVEKLYDIALSYQNAKFTKDGDLDQHEGRWHFNGCQVESLYIHINDREDDGNIILDFDYLSDLFYAKEIEFIHDHMIRLLWHALDNPLRALCRIEMISEREKHRILYEFNHTKTEYPREKTVHQLFEEQAERTPDRIALVFEDKKLTYGELNQKANRLAKMLREKGVKPDSIVGLMVPRSLEMMIGILAVLKAGGVYLPIDPEYPGARIAYMLEDSGAHILLAGKVPVKDIGFRGMVIDPYDEKNMGGDAGNLCHVNKSCDLAYVIYTSGSTGNPKGVMLEHRSVVNFIRGITDKIDFSPEKPVLSVTTMSFDIFVLETLLPLTTGQRIIIANEAQQKIPQEFNRVILENDVRMVQTTPSRIQLMLNGGAFQCFEGLTDIMIGGEAFPEALLEKLRTLTHARIYNMYGPTETTVWSTLKDVTEARKVDLGKPISNTQVYVLDKHLNPVPIGIPGEMYISGDGLSRGYLNRNALTRERFIDNPFIPGTRMYRTGDLARWYPKGDIEYLGRMDFQVKIRGFRIELGEIENRLMKHPNIREAVAADREGKNGNRYLCAYIVSDKTLAVSELRGYLSEELPGYMIPACFVMLDELPVTPNGKIDRKALPEPDASAYLAFDDASPETAEEKALARIWSEVLGVEATSLNHNFFEIGGDSLTVVHMISKVRKEFHVELPMQEIYSYPTLREMSACITRNMNSGCIGNEGLVLLKKGRNKEKNIFFIHAGSGEVSVYHDLCTCLDDHVNCWGLKFEGLGGLAPMNIQMSTLAQKYVGQMIEIQENGPYHIAGWCIGGTIAFEMARQLEAMSRKVGFLGLINSIAPQEWQDIDAFTLDTELPMMERLLKSKEKAYACFSSIQAIWGHIVEEMEKDPAESLKRVQSLIPGHIQKTIPHFEQGDIRRILYYINVIRTLHRMRALYFPPERIRTAAYFFRAAEDEEIILNTKDNLAKWEQYSSVPIRSYTLAGNHFTLFNKRNALNFSSILNAILTS